MKRVPDSAGQGHLQPCYSEFFSLAINLAMKLSTCAHTHTHTLRVYTTQVDTGTGYRFDPTLPSIAHFHILVGQPY